MTHHEVFGVRIDDLDQDELTRLLFDWLSSDAAHTIVTPNPEFILQARRDPGFRNRLNRADLSLPDGVGLRFAVAALTGKHLVNRHTGVDTLTLLAKLCAEQGKHLALVGGDPGVADKAADNLRGLYPPLTVTAIDPGVITEAELIKSDDRIKISIPDSADVIAVGLGQGKQERVMENLRTSRILIGVGGAFDMLAGTRKRAPSTLRKLGLEWVWRLAIEPRRFRRIFNAFPVFPAVVIWDTLKHQRFLAACRQTIPEIYRQLTGL